MKSVRPIEYLHADYVIPKPSLNTTAPPGRRFAPVGVASLRLLELHSNINKDFKDIPGGEAYSLPHLGERSSRHSGMEPAIICCP